MSTVAVGAWVTLAVFTGVFGAIKVQYVWTLPRVSWGQLLWAATALGVSSAAALQAWGLAS